MEHNYYVIDETHYFIYRNYFKIHNAIRHEYTIDTTKYIRGLLGKFPDCIYYFNMNWQIVKKSIFMLLEILIPLKWYAIMTILKLLWKIIRIFLLMVSAYRGIYCQNLRHKLKLCLNKNVLKCSYWKLTVVNFTFLNSAVCAIFVSVLQMLVYIL